MIKSYKYRLNPTKEVRLAEAEPHRRNITRGERGRGRGVADIGRGSEASIYQSAKLYIITYGKN